MQLVRPGGAFDDPEIVSRTMPIGAGGKTLADRTSTAAVIGGFASDLAVQLSSNRPLYMMGRDGMPPKRFFKALRPRTKAPVCSVLLTGAVDLPGLGVCLATAASSIGFGAFLGFTVANVCVTAPFVRRRGVGGVEASDCLRTDRRLRHDPLEQLLQLVRHQPLDDPHVGGPSNRPNVMTRQGAGSEPPATACRRDQRRPHP
ncbi:hypothetical protein [Streptomyces sp. JNUCC 63]